MSSDWELVDIVLVRICTCSSAVVTSFIGISFVVYTAELVKPTLADVTSFIVCDAGVGVFSSVFVTGVVAVTEVSCSVVS